MKLLLALLAAVALTAYILALADGPSLVDIINKYYSRPCPTLSPCPPIC